MYLSLKNIRYIFNLTIELGFTFVLVGCLGITHTSCYICSSFKKKKKKKPFILNGQKCIQPVNYVIKKQATFITFSRLFNQTILLQVTQAGLNQLPNGSNTIFVIL